jgi:hypothetical protein
MPKQAIRLADLENARRALQQAPEPSVDQINKREAIRALTDEIHAAQRRGYRLEAIAELLAKSGIAISLVVLRKYLGEAGSPSGARKKRPKAAARSRPVTLPAPPGSSSPSPGAASPNPPPDPLEPTNARRSEGPPLGPAPIPPKDQASTAIASSAVGPEAPAAKPVAPTPPQPAPARKSSFLPRKDTEDI